MLTDAERQAIEDSALPSCQWFEISVDTLAAKIDDRFSLSGRLAVLVSHVESMRAYLEVVHGVPVMCSYTFDVVTHSRTLYMFRACGTYDYLREFATFGGGTGRVKTLAEVRECALKAGHRELKPADAAAIF